MSREQVLARIRTALRTAPRANESTPGESYQRQATLSRAEILSLFEERLHEYNARTFRCDRDGIARAVAAVLQGAQKRRMVAPAGIPPDWLAADSAEWLLDHALSNEQLNEAEGVLTGASAAVAVSGTIVLQHGAAEGRRVLTLLPDYHLCVVFADQVVETLPEAFEVLVQERERPVTFISGPSATADIEMTRIKGVHGPRFLDVLLVEGEMPPRPARSMGP